MSFFVKWEKIDYERERGKNQPDASTQLHSQADQFLVRIYIELVHLEIESFKAIYAHKAIYVLRLGKSSGTPRGVRIPV